MPILIRLKDPSITLVLAGDIKDESSKEYDTMFPNLMVKNQDGQNMVIPLAIDCNIAYIKEVTQEEIDKQKKEAERRRKEAEAQGGGGRIAKPSMLFPSGRGGRG